MMRNSIPIGPMALGREDSPSVIAEMSGNHNQSLGRPRAMAELENTDIPLIRKVAATGKPMIISTGMATVAELAESVEAAREAGCRNLVLLKCTSTYPATPENTTILTIPHPRELFGCEVGLSDHTMSVGVAVASVALGATGIEKPFTLARSDGGVDSASSMEPDEMKSLVVETERAWQALGQVSYGPTEAERKSLVFRRSIYIMKDLKAGDVLTRENVQAIRPGSGLSGKYIEVMIGLRVGRAVPRGTPLEFGLLDSGASEGPRSAPRSEEGP